MSRSSSTISVLPRALLTSHSMFIERAKSAAARMSMTVARLVCYGDHAGHREIWAIDGWTASSNLGRPCRTHSMRFHRQTSPHHCHLSQGHLRLQPQARFQDTSQQRRRKRTWSISESSWMQIPYLRSWQSCLSAWAKARAVTAWSQKNGTTELETQNWIRNKMTDLFVTHAPHRIGMFRLHLHV